MSSRAPLAPYAAVAVTVLSWAAAFPAIRLALRELQPVPLAAARFAVAALLVLGWLAWRRPQRPALPDLLRFALCGLIGIAAYNILLNTGQRTVAAGAASFIVNTAPILTALLARLALGERFGARGWAGTLVSFAGIALIASAQPGGLAFGAGASLVLGSALCMACYVVLQKPLVARHGALACTAWTLLAGALWLSPWLPDAAGELPQAGAATVATVIGLGVLPAAIGYATWTTALGHFGAARATNFLYLVPPVATAIAVPLLGETPGPQTLLGGAVAIAGVVLVNTRGRAGSASAEPPAPRRVPS
ncbi:DMT family transporter [Inquilinus sp. Marseille-Q2685]|uniref:DMT family transporter n=1 Tax=Inquilinus sp. Marseille-Q2685 TaxID=2866581 RepID=UPI001CE4326C|nr:DMT family transporter [Inquilinus sp. Marseille-Q2685]